jgi:hypothetical protein
MKNRLTDDAFNKLKSWRWREYRNEHEVWLESDNGTWTAILFPDCLVLGDPDRGPFNIFRGIEVKRLFECSKTDKWIDESHGFDQDLIPG